jgi:deoxyribose-phosphate aldolase
MTPGELARRIEHTLLRPEATPDQIDALCDEAVACGFVGVCVNPIHVRRAAARLGSASAPHGDRPMVVSVAGFPLGASCSEVKADEAARAMDDGAHEIDMVIALGALIAGDRAEVRRDVETVARVVHGRHPPGMLKAILETAALTEQQIVLACRLCAEGEADFVKTSTGFHPAGGATLEHVRLLHRCASPLRIKASGGIRTAATAMAMIQAGAARIGTSSGPAILEEWRRGLC